MKGYLLLAVMVGVLMLVGTTTAESQQQKQNIDALDDTNDEEALSDNVFDDEEEFVDDDDEEDDEDDSSSILNLFQLNSRHSVCDGKAKGGCKKRGGSCVTQPFKKNCRDLHGPYGLLKKKACKSKACRCCAPPPTCEGKIEKPCSNNGGYCVVKPFKANCKGGKLHKDKKACKGKHCQCCIPAIMSLDDFMLRYNKHYDNTTEAKKRADIFHTNVIAMEDHNKLYQSGNSSFMMGVNKFSDMTYEEIVSKYTGRKVNNLHNRNMHTNWYIPTDIGNEPPNMDYRNMGAVNPIRSQGGCGSCWAFSAVGSIESQIFLKHGILVQLSEQYLLDCVTDNGCAGFWENKAIEYVINNGIANRDVYPYNENEGTCDQHTVKTVYNVKGIQQVIPKSDKELLNALVRMGPLTVAIYISDVFPAYYSGIIDASHSGCSENDWANHAVVLVGYGTESGQDYWLIRNSWGDTLGADGYIKLSRNSENLCQISSEAYIPIIEDKNDLINWDESCPSPYKLRGAKCIFVHEDKNDLLNWDESRQRCISMGGDLAQPQDMVDFVKYIKENYPDSKSTIWLGATDREVEQDWHWVSGEPVPPAMWTPWPGNQPNGDGNCMEIHYWPNTDFYMNDWYCHNKGHFACEKSPSGVVDFNGAGTADSTSKWSSGYGPEYAFDGRRDTYWASASQAEYPQSIWFEFNNPITVVKFAFRSTDYSSETVDYGPIKYELFYSDDSDCSKQSSWVTIYTEDNGDPFTLSNNERKGVISNNVPHKCYGFKVNKVPEGSDYGIMVTMHDIQFWDV